MWTEINITTLNIKIISTFIVQLPETPSVVKPTVFQLVGFLVLWSGCRSLLNRLLCFITVSVITCICFTMLFHL